MQSRPIELHTMPAHSVCCCRENCAITLLTHNIIGGGCWIQISTYRRRARAAIICLACLQFRPGSAANPAYLLRSVRHKSNSQLTLSMQRRRGEPPVARKQHPALQQTRSLRRLHIRRLIMICNEIWFGKRAHAEILREILQQTPLQPNGKYTHSHSVSRSVLTDWQKGSTTSAAHTNCEIARSVCVLTAGINKYGRQTAWAIRVITPSVSGKVILLNQQTTQTAAFCVLLLDGVCTAGGWGRSFCASQFRFARGSGSLRDHPRRCFNQNRSKAGEEPAEKAQIVCSSE